MLIPSLLLYQFQEIYCREFAFAEEMLNGVATVFPGVNWIRDGNLGGASIFS